MKKILTVCLLLYSIIFTAAFKGCPTKSTPETDERIRSIAKASYRLPGATNDIIEAIKTGVTKSIFTPAQARTFGGILEPITQAEATLVQLVKAANAYYKKTGTIDANQISVIRVLLDDKIIRPFASILEQYRILTPGASALLQAAIAAVRALLTTIGTGVGSTLLNLLSAADPPAKSRIGKKGNTTAGLFGSIRPFAFNPHLMELV